MAQPLEAAPLVAGAIVQRADVGERAVVLKTRRPGETVYVLAITQRGVGIAPDRAPRPANSRSVPRLEGFRVAWLTRGTIALERHREGSETVEWALIDVQAGRLRLSYEAPEPPPSDKVARDDERAAWEARGAEIAGRLATDAVDARRAEALRAVRRGIARVARRVEAVTSDLARIEDAQRMAEHLPWLVAEAARAPRGATSLKVTDWSTGEARAIEVPLDPSKPAKTQVDAMFARARRLKQGAEMARVRRADAEAALAKLEPIVEEVTRAIDVQAIDVALGRARAAAPRDVKLDAVTSSGKRELQPKALPYRAFHARDGRARILVGRGAAHNDALTFQVARPQDLWLHTKGLPGAHVIVPLGKQQTCPPDVLADAAHLAAHFSDARDEAVVDVEYAQRRHLRKPRGSAAGFVVVEREKVIAVRVDPIVLRALLESEDA
jgi:predicted ribosome quality control (RQC) complex YloA/Tae2 family protein